MPNPVLQISPRRRRLVRRRFWPKSRGATCGRSPRSFPMSTLPRPGACRARRPDRGGADHPGRADRGAAHDRFRLHRARARPDQQLFPGDDRRRGGAGAVASALALLPRHHARRAHRRRSAQRRVRAPHLALAAPSSTRARPANWSRGSPPTPRRSKPRSASSVSVALRNLVLFFGATAMMVVTSPRLSAFVLAAIPVIVLPLFAFGRAVRRRSRTAQDTLADASAYAAELIGAMRVLQAFTNERLAIARFGGAVERAFEAARNSTRARAVLTAHRHLPRLRQRRGRAVGRRAGRAGGEDHARPAQPVRAVCGVRGRRARLAVGDRRRGRAGLGRGGAAVRDSCDQACDRRAGAAACAAVAAARRSRFRRRAISPIRRGRNVPTLDGVSFRVRQGEKVAIVGPSGRRQEHDLPSAAALLRSARRARSRSTACGSRTSIRRSCARASRWCRRTA